MINIESLQVVSLSNQEETTIAGGSWTKVAEAAGSWLVGKILDVAVPAVVSGAQYLYESSKTAPAQHSGGGYYSYYNDFNE